MSPRCPDELAGLPQVGIDHVAHLGRGTSSTSARLRMMSRWGAERPRMAAGRGELELGLERAQPGSAVARGHSTTGNASRGRRFAADHAGETTSNGRRPPAGRSVLTLVGKVY